MILKSGPLPYIYFYRFSQFLFSRKIKLKDPPISLKDGHLYYLLTEERKRQEASLDLSLNSNIMSRATTDCLSSPLDNISSSGFPGFRLYKGNQIIDKIEQICQTRALNLFNLSPDEWGVNVQPYSRSYANFAAINALLEVDQKIMYLIPPYGDVSHGFKIGKMCASGASKYYITYPYVTYKDNGNINHNECKKLISEFMPNLLICGYSAYPRNFDYEKFKDYSRICKAFLMADISHSCGMIISGEYQSPFPFCDVVTMAGNFALRGPPCGLIFYRKESLIEKIKLEDKINYSIFPMIQGSPHNSFTAALATQLLEAQTKEYKDTVKLAKRNAQILSNFLIDKGFDLITNGTDNHIILINTYNTYFKGIEVMILLENINILVDRFHIPRNQDSNQISGICINMLPITYRKCTPYQVESIGYIISETMKIAKMIKFEYQTFKKYLISTIIETPEFSIFKTNVENIAKSLHFPKFQSY